MIDIVHHEQNISLLFTINGNYFFFSMEDFPQPVNTRKYNEHNNNTINIASLKCGT